MLTAGVANQGVYYDMVGDAAQNSTWDVSAYVQRHAPGDDGRLVYAAMTGAGGVNESFSGTPVAVGNGWSVATVTGQYVNAAHTDAYVALRQSGVGAAFSFDLDGVQYARHLAYLPSANPFVTGLWVAGKPAGNYSEPSDAATVALLQSGLYAGA